MRSVVFVEGDSDRAAVETLAGRLGRDLAAEGVSIVSMGGASLLAASIENVLVTTPPDTKLAGLCDEAETDQFCDALERVGLGSDLSVAHMEALGFFVCVRDLEDELIRSLGPSAIEDVLADQGEMKAFRTFQNQPHWREMPIDEQFHRFTGVKSGRKVRYGRELVAALDLTRVPRPLELLLSFV